MREAFTAAVPARRPKAKAWAGLVFVLAVTMAIVGPGAVAPANATPSGYTAADLGSLTAPTQSFDSWAYASNDHGDVAGYALAMPADAPHAAWREPNGHWHDLGTLGGRLSSAQAINESGWIVGYSHKGFNDPIVTHAFLWRPSAMTDLGTLGGHYSAAYGVNDSGLVVGGADTPTATHAFVWDTKHKMVDIGTLGGDGSFATAVSNAGQVVGSAGTAAHRSHAFLWDATNGMIDLGTLGGTNSSAEAINNRGQVAGVSDTAGGQSHAFLWDPVGGMTDLGTLGGVNSTAHGINDAGQVVGDLGPSTGSSRAFVWDAGAGGMVDLGTLGGPDARAFAIDSNGVIVGGSSQPPQFDEIIHATAWTSEVVFGSPATGAHYVQGQAVEASFSCFAAATSCTGTVPSGALINTSTLGAHTFSVTVTDPGGATHTVTHTYTVDPDTSPPAISLSSPAEGGVVAVGDVLKAQYGCSDAGSGLGSCVGDAPNGATIDTSVAGVRTFTVTAADNVNNTTSVTHQYIVTGRTISVGSASVVEGDTGKPRSLRFPVTLSRASNQEVTAHWTLETTGSARTPDDVQAKSGIVRFEPSSRTGSTVIQHFVTVNVSPDIAVEGDESFRLVLSDPTGGYTVARPIATGTILDDDPGSGLHVDIGDMSVSESCGGTTVAKLTITLSAPADTPVSVDVNVVGGTASAGGDYIWARTKSFLFDRGQWQKAVAVKVLCGGGFTPNETILFSLSNPSTGLSIGRSVGTVTILEEP